MATTKVFTVGMLRAFLADKPEDAIILHDDPEWGEYGCEAQYISEHPFTTRGPAGRVNLTHPVIILTGGGDQEDALVAVGRVIR